MPTMWTGDLCLYGKVIQDRLLAHNGQLRRKSGDVQPLPDSLHTKYSPDWFAGVGLQLTVLLCTGSGRKEYVTYMEWQHSGNP